MRKNFTKIVLSSALALGFTSVSVPSYQAQASTINYQITSQDISELQNSKEFQNKQIAIAKSITFKDGKYLIDEKSLTNNELTKYEIDQVNSYFSTIDQKSLVKFSEEVTKNGFLNNQVLYNEQGLIIKQELPPLLPIVVIVFLGGLALTVGKTLATRITNDFYTWGVTGACKKWKGNSVVRSFCESNGYL